MGGGRGNTPVGYILQLRDNSCKVLTDHLVRFWENAIKTATPTSQRRFVDAFQLYLDSVVQQAEDRTRGYIRDIHSYFDVRRDTIGAKPSFAINELYMDLPDYVLADPIIMKLTSACIDMLIIGNDLCSYNIESVFSYLSLPS